ncbi:MAG: DUF2029 domain-containing protein [Deltaproteobacteria bacterium]|nr:DUF2029 domain-containing protein [Deltaproteobacteria bacterium]
MAFAIAFLQAFFAYFLRLVIYDDAYITYRYARNWADGLGPVFNAGDRVEGCTTFLQMAVLVPFEWLNVDPRFASLVISIAALALVSTWSAVWIARRTPEADAAGVWPRFAFWLTLTNPALMYWTISGMETMWFVAAIFAATMTAAWEMEGDRVPWRSGLLAAIAALIRPDGAVVVVALAVAWSWLVPNRRPRAFVIAALGVAAIGALTAWRLSYYGDPVPNTFYAKVGASNFHHWLRGLWYVVRAVFSAVIPVPLIWLAWRRSKVGARWSRFEKLLLVVIVGQVAQTIWTGGDYMGFYRFLAPVWPLALMLLWSLATTPHAQGVRTPSSYWRLQVPARKWVVLVAGLQILNIFIDMNGLKVMIGQGLTRQWEAQARVMRRIIPTGTLVADTAIGASGYLTNLPMIDMMGLTDRTIARTKMPMGRRYPGHEKFNSTYVLSRKPAFILICTKLSPAPMPKCPYDEDGFASMPARTDMMKTSDFQRDYVYANYAARDTYIGIYMRRELLGTSGFENWFVADPHDPAGSPPPSQPVAK